MDGWCCTLIIVLLVILLYKTGYLVFNETTACSNLDGSCYKIISSFDPSTHVKAANELARINSFNANLITYLRNNYLWNPNKQTSESPRDADMKVITENLIRNYNPNVLKENNPTSTANTSYVLEKGASIAFCLREKNSGDNKFEDDSMINFVNLHEVSHLAMKYHDPSHSKEFWKTFRLVAEAAVEAGIYHPINYKSNPSNYCGVPVDYNPIYDDSLNSE
jgi:hypothetical protein